VAPGDGAVGQQPRGQLAHRGIELVARNDPSDQTEGVGLCGVDDALSPVGNSSTGAGTLGFDRNKARESTR
jgi:hypothetical protein